jgi:Ca2+:H+ antiporter
MNLLMLLLALLCHLLPMLFQYGGASVAFDADSSLQFSRAASIVMVIAYFAYLIFQLWTHRQLFEAQDVCFVLFNFEMVKLIVNFIYVLW